MDGWPASDDRRDGGAADAMSARLQRPARDVAAGFGWRLPAVLTTAFAVMLSAIAVADPERVSDRARAVAAEFERVAVKAGFGISEVTISGHRFTQDADVYDQIGLDQKSSLIGFNVAAAKARIEQLSWVARADVARVFPNRLDIRLSERTPFAVWSDSGRANLIDATGRTLGLVPSTAMPELPRIEGAGANEAAAGLFAELQNHKDIAASLATATRIAARRWTLTLTDGVAVELPELNIAAALQRFLALKADGAIGARQTIDLRHPARAVVRAARPERTPPAIEPLSGVRS